MVKKAQPVMSASDAHALGGLLGELVAEEVQVLRAEFNARIAQVEHTHQVERAALRDDLQRFCGKLFVDLLQAQPCPPPKAPGSRW